SAVYRVSVIFMEPPARLPYPQPVLQQPEPAVYPDYAGHLSGTVGVGANGRAKATFDFDLLEVGKGLVQIRHFSGTKQLQTLQETRTDPPPAGQFRVVDAKTLDFVLPAATVVPRDARYVLHVRPAPGVDPVDFLLDVPP